MECCLCVNNIFQQGMLQFYLWFRYGKYELNAIFSYYTIRAYSKMRFIKFCFHPSSPFLLVIVA